MKNLMITLAILLAGIQATQACEMESAYRKCAEAVGSQDVQALHPKVNIEGVNPDDFTFKKVANFLVISYARPITQDKQGTLEFTKDGAVSTRSISMKARGAVVEAEEKQEKLKSGLKGLLEQLKPATSKN